MKDLVELNEIKHHRRYIETFIVSNRTPITSNDFRQVINRIGNSTLDLYYGELNSDSIKEEICQFLAKRNINTKKELTSFISIQNQKHLNVEVSDTSKWTLRVINKRKYIHIHPARHSHLTIRCTGAALKTLIATYCSGVDTSPGLREINHARAAILLPPIKKLVRNRGLDKLFKFFQNGSRKHS